MHNPTVVTSQRSGPAKRSILIALLLKIAELRLYSDVLWQLVRQFLTLRYRRTALGYVWTLINPLMMMSVTAVVFATLFKLDLSTYAVFLFAGMVPWNFFSMTVTQSCTAFIHNEGLIKKIYLPKIVFPLSQAIGMAVDSFLALMALFVLVIPFGAPLTPALLFLPVTYVLLFTFTFGVALIVSVATVFFRDLQYVISVVMQAWFFLTPVMYRHDALAGKVAAVVALNPMVAFIELFRAPLYLGQWPSLQAVGVAAVTALCTLALGLLILLRQEKHIVFRL